MSVDPALGLLVGALLATLLAGAGIHKLQHLQAFDAAFAAYDLAPPYLTRLRLQRVLPAIELAFGVGLLIETTRRPSALLACALLLMYAAAIGINLRRGRRSIDCGCSIGGQSGTIGHWMVWRNIVIATIAAMSILPRNDRVPGVLDVMTVLGGWIVAVMMYQTIDRLLGDVAKRAARLRGAI